MENNFPIGSLKAFASFSSGFQGLGSELEAVLILDILYETYSPLSLEVFGIFYLSLSALVWVGFHSLCVFHVVHPCELVASVLGKFLNLFYRWFIPPHVLCSFLLELLLIQTMDTLDLFPVLLSIELVFTLLSEKFLHSTLQISYCIFNFAYHTFNFQELFEICFSRSLMAVFSLTSLRTLLLLQFPFPPSCSFLFVLTFSLIYTFSSNLWDPPAVCSSLRVGCCGSFLCEVLHGVIWLSLIRAGQRQVFQSHAWRVWLSTFWKPGRKKSGDLNILCAAVHLLCLLQYWAPAFCSWPQPWSPLGWRQGSASLLRVRRRVRSSFPLAASPSFPPPEVPVVASPWGCPGFCATNLGVLSVCLLFLWPVQDGTFSGLVNYYLFLGPPASRIWLLLPSLFFPLSDWVYSFHCHFSGAWGENRGVQTSILTKTKLLNLSHVWHVGHTAGIPNAYKKLHFNHLFTEFTE